MKNKQTKIIVISIAIISILCIVGFSYAFFAAKILGNDKAEEMKVTAGTMVLEYSEETGGGTVVFENMKPPVTIEKKFKVYSNSTLDTSYNIKLTNIETTFKGPDLIYSLEETDESYTPKEEIPSKDGIINIGTVKDGTIYLKGETEIKPQETHYYKLTITFQNFDDINQNYNQGAIFSGKVNIGTGETTNDEYIASYSDYCIGEEDLASCMLKYADKFKDFVATDDPDSNARFMGADPNNYIYFNCADYNNPTKETCELWRIIGSFNNIELADNGGTKNLVKIIRNDNIAKDAGVKAMDWSSEIEGLRQEFDSMYEQMKDTECQGMEKEECLNSLLKSEGIDPDNPSMYGLSWDYRGTERASSSTAYNNSSNDWTESTLMKTLNSGYDDNQMTDSGTKVSNSLYWNRESGICWSTTTSDMENYDPTVECDFGNTGLRITTHNMIEKVKWHLGGSSSYSGVTAQTFYNLERGTDTYNGQPSEWEGKVALMYPSDYGYATSGGSTTRKTCLDTALYNWNSNIECYNNDWLLDKNSSNMGEWTLAPTSVNSGSVFGVGSGGGVRRDNASFPVSVRPSLYLDSRVNLVGGVGTKSNPYVIKSA